MARDIYEAQNRLERIERALNELWGIHDASLLSDEALIVRIVEMRAESAKACMAELLASHERVVEQAATYKALSRASGGADRG